MTQIFKRRKAQSSKPEIARLADKIPSVFVPAVVVIATGTGTDVAIESADVVILQGSLLKVPEAIELSKATVINIKQNLIGAFFYNTVSIPVAAGLLYPLFGVLLNPMIAGAAMALSSVTVVTNANRLRWTKFVVHK